MTIYKKIITFVKTLYSSLHILQMVHLGNRLDSRLIHLPPEKRAELDKISHALQATGLASMIILYGSYARGDWKNEPGIRSGKRSDFDILVLTRDERDHLDLEQKVHKMFEHFPTVVQILVETLSFANKQLREQQYFFTEIKQQGVILYADKDVRLASAENLPPERLKEIAFRDFKHWFGLAQGFLATSKFQYESGYLQLCAFSLQQCVEHCYTVIEILHSRSNPHEHRLMVLRPGAKRYVPEVDTCFPCETEEGKYLFHHLDAAYIAGRYPDVEQYNVTREQINYWETEAQKLMALTERICLLRIGDIG